MTRALISGDVAVQPNWASRPSRSVVAYTEKILYDFVQNNSSRVECFKSIDSGSTWASVGELTTQGACRTFDIYYERWTSADLAPIVHIAAHVDASPRGFIYSRITLGTDIISGEAVLKEWGAAANPGRTSIVIDEAGALHAFGRGGDLSGQAWHFYSDDAGETWTDSRSISMTPAFTFHDFISAWPDFAGDPGDLQLVHGDDSAGGDLFLHRYDHSADTWSDVTIDSGFDHGDNDESSVGFAWRRSDGHLWVFGVHANDVSPATCKVWEITGATVTARTDLVEETYLRVAAGSMLPDGRLLGAYSYDPTDTGPLTGDVQGVFYKLSDDDGVTWGDEITYSELADLPINRILTDPNPYVSVAPILYHEDDNEYIEAPVLVVDETPPADDFRLMLAEAPTPDVPTLNITEHASNALSGTMVKFERGYSRGVIGEPPQAAVMTARLANPTLSRYSLDGPTPGLAMRLNKKIGETWYHLCQVNLDVPQHEMVGERFRAEIDTVGYGTLTKLSGKTVSTDLYEDIPVGFAMAILLEAAGVDAILFDLDAGEVRLPWWWVNEGDALAELNKLRFSEGITSDLYEDGEGRIVFRSRSARYTEPRSVAAQVSFVNEGDEPQLTGFEYYGGLHEVLNAASHSRNVRLVDGAPSIVWEDVPAPGGHFIVMPGLPVTVEAVADSPFKDAITPEAGTDYQIVSFGSTVTPTLERTSGQRTRITFTATGDGGAIINELQLRATAVPVEHTVVEISTVDAAASIAAYGRKPWVGEMSEELTRSDMRDNLDVIVNWRKDPRGRIRFGLGAYHGAAANEQTAIREIGDRVRVVDTDLNFDGDCWIQRIEHEINAPASSSDGSLPADEFTWYEGIVVSVAPGSSGSGVGGNNPYEDVDNGQGESPTTGLTDQGLLMRGIIGPLFGASDTPTITPPPGEPDAPPDPPIEGTTPGLVGFGRFNHDDYDGTLHVTSGTAGQIASMRAALTDGARVIIDSGVLIQVSNGFTPAANAQILSPLDGAGASIQATGPTEIIDIAVPNVRVQNLYLRNYGDADGDENQRCINVNGANARDYWFDKLTIDNTGQSVGVAYGEGINIFGFPAKANSPGAGTISRCYFVGKTAPFELSTKALLIAAKNDLPSDAAETIRVTVYQCNFEMQQRMALQRQGSYVHYINCVYPLKNKIYGIGVQSASHAVIEGCMFYGSTQADRWEVNANASGESVDNTARIYVPTSSGELRAGFSANGINLLDGTAQVNDVNPGSAFNPVSFYGYTVQPATDILAAAIIAAAGHG